MKGGLFMSNGITYVRYDSNNPLEKACTHPWEFYMKPFKIFGNLFFVGNRRVSSYLIDTGNGLILIDTGFASTVYLLLNSIHELGYNPKEIKYILHTHCHFDHIQGTKAIIELTGCKTAIPESEPSYLNEKSYLNMAEHSSLGYFEEFNPDILLSEGDEIILGNTTIHIVSTPGHSIGSQSFFFDVKGESETYSTVILGGLGLTPLRKELLEQVELPLSLRGEYVKSIEKLFKWHPDIILSNHPHHTDLFGKLEERIKNPSGPNPFITPNDWESFLESKKQELEDVIRGERSTNL